MMTQERTITEQQTCSARLGFWPGDYGLMPAFCSTTIGLVRYTDIHGIERRYCRHHGALVRHRWPVKTTSPLRLSCVVCKRDIDDDLYILVNHGTGTAPVCWRCQEQGE